MSATGSKADGKEPAAEGARRTAIAGRRFSFYFGRSMCTSLKSKSSGPSIAIAGTGLLLALCGCTLCGCSQPTEAVEPPPPKVTIANPEVRELTDYDEYNGWTAPSQTVEVRSRVRGHIVKVNFTDGQLVDAGDPLFELDPQPFEAEIGKAQAQVAIAEAQQNQALITENRMDRLHQRGAATDQELEEAQAERKTWDAQVGATKDEVKRREMDATFAKITAPIPGKIGRAQLTEGNLVNAGVGDPVLTTIVSLDPIHVYFNVDERSVIRYRQRRRETEKGGLQPLETSKIPFEFRLENERGFPHKGVLNFADNRIDPTTGTVEIRGKADNPDARFLPGGRVRVRVAVSEPYRAVLVPDTAVLTDQDKKYVLCLNEKDVVVRRDVRLGKLLDDGMRVVLPRDEKEQGLIPEDRVIVVGLQRARINYPVEPMDDEGNQIAKAD
jgi:RND family efflux transporter MFP subunit